MSLDNFPIFCSWWDFEVTTLFTRTPYINSILACMVCVQWKGKHSTCTVSFCLSTWFTPKSYGLWELYFLFFVSPELWTMDTSTIQTIWKIYSPYPRVDVFPWDIDTMIPGKSRTCDVNRRLVKGHLQVIWSHCPFGESFCKMVVLYYPPLYFDVFPWDLTQWSLGKFAHETSTEMESKGHLGSLTFWLKIWNMITVYFDVFPWDPWVELHMWHNKSGIKGHFGVTDLLVTVFEQLSQYLFHGTWTQ